jgi:hypothetical protein
MSETVVYPPSNRHAMNGIQSSMTTVPSGDHFTVWRYHRHEFGRLEPVEEDDNPRYVMPIRWDMYCGVLIPVPPPELLPLMSPDWTEPQRCIQYVAALPTPEKDKDDGR